MAIFKQKQAYDDGKNILVTVMAAMGQEKIISFKETAEGK